MINTTLCYIEWGDEYLMLHRTKKEHDINEGKWIGVGGKFEADEMPEECLLREVKEETGLTLFDFRLRAVITFISDASDTEYMFLYTADAWEGELIECDEGDLSWVKKSDVPSLNLWEGDRKFLRLLAEDAGYFSMKLKYEGDRLVEDVVYGAEK